jgi:hypothetical protein
MEKRRKYILLMISGVILIVLGFLYQALELSGNVISLLFINAGIVMMVVAVLKYNKLGAGVDQDEMTRKMSSRGLSYSWLLTFVTINVLFWMDYVEVVRLSVPTVLGIVMFVMVISASVCKKWLFRTGI